jgi:hypothetical protein
MVVDHIGWILFPQINLLRIIGRLSFPIFAFLIAEGSLKTKNINSYIKRLFIFGAISQVPYSYTVFLAGENFLVLNIFFTLAFGLVLIKKIQQQQYFHFSILIILFSILDLMIHYDYGLYGLLLIIFFYVFLKNKILGSVLIIFTTVLESIKVPVANFEFQNQIFAIATLIPILLYNGQQGKKISKLFFYLFYPIHLLIISLFYILLTK